MTEQFDCTDPEQRATGIASAISALKGGRLVVMPTDTVYGIGADAFDTHGHCWLTPESFAQYGDDGTAPEVTERPSDSAQRLAGGVMS